MIRTDSYIARIEAENQALRTELSTTRQERDALINLREVAHDFLQFADVPRGVYWQRLAAAVDALPAPEGGGTA